MGDKYLYFFDLNEKLLDRFPYEITSRLANINSQAKYVFIYSEKYEKNGTPNKLSKDSLLFYLPNLSLKKLNQLIKKYPPISLTTFGLRIPDILVLFYFNLRGFKTNMVQHGIFINHIERIPFFKLIQSKFLKFIKYTNFSFKISILRGSNFFYVLHNLYLFYYKGSQNFSNLKILSDKKFISNVAFIFDKSWVKYYHEKYGYKKKQMIFVGNPDYLIFNKILNSSKQKAICYICQSLVEDGRYLESDYTFFLNTLIYKLKDYKIYLKLHPRSRINLYKKYESHGVILTRSFPYCTHYLGHYSSLLEIASYLDSSVCIWDLHKHNIPNEYLKYCNLFTSDWDEFILFCQKFKVNKINPKVYNFVQKNINPYLTIATKISEN